MCGGTGQVRAEAASTLILLVQGNARPPYYQIMLKLRAIDPTFIHESYRAIELKPRRTP